MLDVHGGHDVNAGVEGIEDVQIAFGVPAARELVFLEHHPARAERRHGSLDVGDLPGHLRVRAR